MYGGGYGAAQQEPVFFQDGAVYVSRSRVVINGTTYPVNGITAVRSAKIGKSPFWLICGILAGCVGALFMFAGIAAAVNDDGGGGSIVFGLLCLLVCAGGVAIFLWLQTNTYMLVLGTAGREVTALTHGDWRYIGAVVEGINNALASRY